MDTTVQVAAKAVPSTTLPREPRPAFTPDYALVEPDSHQKSGYSVTWMRGA
jgi:hypothetical protein